MGLKAKEYLGFEVLVGEEGNSFYGSRFGNHFCCSVEGWFLWIKILRFGEFLTSTATAERFFKILRVYCSEILSTDRGLVVPRFCKRNQELEFRDSLVDRQRKGSLRLHRLTTWKTLVQN